MVKPRIVSPPFRDNKQATSFVAVLMLILLAPFIPTKLLGIEPYQVYLSFPAIRGNYNFIGDKMAEGGDVDILLIGGSNAHTGFDANYLAELLGEQLGREVRVYNFGASWYGAEVDLVRLTDALHTLKPKLVLLPDADVGAYYPHELARMLWRVPPERMPEGLSLVEHATLYSTAMLGAPRLTYATLSKIWERPERPDLESHLNRYRKASGFQAEAIGWLSHHDPDRNNRLSYEPVDYTPPVIPVEDMKFNGFEDGNFEILPYTYSSYQSAFIAKIAEVASEDGVKFAMVSMPTHFGKDSPNEKSWVRPLSEGYERDWPQIGISMRQLFPDMTFDEMKRFYSNETHLNARGAKVFNRALTPALAELLKDAS